LTWLLAHILANDVVFAQIHRRLSRQSARPRVLHITNKHQHQQQQQRTNTSSRTSRFRFGLAAADQRRESGGRREEGEHAGGVLVREEGQRVVSIHHCTHKQSRLTRCFTTHTRRRRKHHTCTTPTSILVTTTIIQTMFTFDVGQCCVFACQQTKQRRHTRT